MLRLVVVLLLAGPSRALAAAGGNGGGAGNGQGEGLAAAGAVGAPGAPVPFGMPGGGPALAGHGPLSPAPSAASKKSVSMVSGAMVSPDTGGSNSPGAPTGLTYIPLVVSAVDSTTPTLSATYNNGGSYTGYVQYQVLSYAGAVLATGVGTTVNPGATSTWNYPTSAPPLQVGAEYKVQAESVSGSYSSGYVTNGTFYVDPRLAWGDQPWMTNITWNPDSQMTVRANVASGDLGVSLSMLQSVAGVDLPIRLNFVSNGQQASASGESRDIAYGWTGTFDENLYLDPTGQSITYFGPDGNSAAFIKSGSSWNSPGDLPATLTTSGSTETLTWNSSDSSHSAGQVDTFSNGVLTRQQSATGQSIQISSNANGAPATMTTSTGRTFNFTYYSSGTDQGQLESIQLAGSSFELQFGYDSTGTLLTSVKNPDLGTTQFGYQSLNDQINSITTPAGRQLTIGYDSSGTKVASVSQVDNLFPTNPTWSFTYTDPTYTTGGTQCVPGQSQFACGTTVVEDPNTHNTTYTWDNADRVTNTLDALGQTRSTQWTSDNNVTQLTVGGTSSTQTESFAWDPTYDVLNTVTNPVQGTTQGDVTQLSWNTTSSPYTLSSVTDNNSHSVAGGTNVNVAYGYNSDHEISTVTEGGNTEYLYYQGIGPVSCGGLTGDLCQVQDFDGYTTNYQYNSAGELTQITPPTQTGGTQLGSTSFGYNALGQVTSKTDGNGNTTTYQWNGENQITKITYQDATSVSLGYDSDGNLLSETAPGGNSSFTYSPVGYLKTSDINGDNTTYYYDPVGNVTSTVGPLGTTTYKYTNVNVLNEVDDPWGKTTTLQHNQPNNDQLVTEIDLPGGTKELYGYDNANRPNSYLVKNGAGSTVINDTYTYLTSSSPANDENLMVSSSINGQSTTYGYDTAGRLLSATGGGTNYSYTYNGDGDLTSQGMSPNQNHENAGDTYDAAGNLTAYTALGTLTYNTADQTTSINVSGGSNESVSYLSDGQTLPTNFGGVDLSYNALGSDSLSGGSNVQVLRTPDGQPLGEFTSGAAYYDLLTPTGSVAGLVDANGNQVDNFTYSPYGAQTASLNNVYDPFAYNGALQVPGTKLLQFGDRLYSPVRNQWLQPDPSGQSSGYVYANDDPVNLVDLSGLNVCKSFFGSIGLGGACKAVSNFSGDVYNGVSGCLNGGALARLGIAGLVARGVAVSDPVGWVLTGLGCAAGAGGSQLTPLLPYEHLPW